MLSLLLFACASAPEADDVEVGVPELDAPVTTPAWTAADVAAAWDAAMAGGWPDVGEPIALYLDFMAHGDADCPGDPLQMDQSVVMGCTADSEYYFSGISVYRTEDDGAGTGGVGLHGDFRLEDPVGNEFRVGGTAYQLWSADTFREYVEGTWVWDADDGPFATGVSGVAETTIAGGAVTVDGALGFGGIAFEMDALTIDATGCASGTLALRDPAVGWHEVTLDCDGCGMVTHESGASGEACFDLGPIAALPADRMD